MKSSRARQWLISTIPALVIGLVVASWLPPRTPEVIVLDGTWQASEVVGGVEGPARPIELPGNFAEQGLTSLDVVLRRHQDLPPALRGVDLTFAIGFVADAVFTVLVNGRLVGQRGDLQARTVNSDSELSSWLVPAPGGEALDLELRVHSFEHLQSGVLDPRILIGRASVVERWAFRERALRSMLGLGGILTLLFVAGLVAVVWVVQGTKASADVFVSTLGLLITSAVYLSGMAGFPFSLVLTADQLSGFILGVLAVLGLFIVEFIESYFIARVTWLRWVSRAVSGSSALAMFVGSAFSIDTVERIYQGYTVWLLAVVAYSLAVSSRALWRGDRRFAPVLTAAIVTISAAGVCDLLGDLNVLITPRIFVLAVFNLAIVTAVVVVGEFLGLTDENRGLTASLALRNVELTDALERATESSRLKSEFLAQTSHELRTPLNAIINIPQGLIEAFVEDPAGTPLRFELEPLRARKLLQNVATSGQHLLAIVDNLLDLSRLEAGRLTLARRRVSLGSIFETVSATMAPLAQAAGVPLELDEARALELEVDPVRVAQVLINLASNAVKFSEGKGTVRISSRVDEQALRIAVRDEGIGIAIDQHEVIFEGFRQAAGGSTRRFGGTGLGLAISRRIATLHGGWIEVRSAPGQGSTFTLVLPRA